MKKKELPEPFWITNITKASVSLRDLNVIIYPYRSINLMDTRHYSFQREELLKSASSGSLKLKSNAVVVRLVAPNTVPKKRVLIQEDAVFQTRQRSAVELENIKYEELNVSDDDFAAENSDTAEADHLGKYNK